MAENQELVFSVAIIRRGADLVIVRPLSQGERAKWAFPAGPVEADEAPEVACRRVCQEKLGVTVHIDFGQPPLQGGVDDQKVIYRYHFCHIPEGDIRNLGFADARWIRIGDLLEYEFDPTTQMVVDWLLKKEE